MALNYAGFLTAPMLRVGWILFGRVATGIHQWDANLAQTMFLMPETVLVRRPRPCAVLRRRVLRRLQRRDPVRKSPARPPPTRGA